MNKSIWIKIIIGYGLSFCIGCLFQARLFGDQWNDPVAIPSIIALCGGFGAMIGIVGGIMRWKSAAIIGGILFSHLAIVFVWLTTRTLTGRFYCGLMSLQDPCLFSAAAIRDEIITVMATVFLGIFASWLINKLFVYLSDPV